MTDPREAPKRVARKRGQRSYTAATISRDIRAMGLTSLHFMGGVKYLNKVAKSNPAAYLAFIAKLIKQDDASAHDGGITFIVQTLAVNAGPVPGVIASPIAEHIAPPLKLISNGVVDD